MAALANRWAEELAHALKCEPLGQWPEEVLLIASDCSGMGCKERAVSKLLRHLPFLPFRATSLYLCDSWSGSQKFLAKAFLETTILGDALERTFHKGGFRAKTVQGEEFATSKSPHVYSCGFPCTPFSLRGKQLAWASDDAKPFYSAVKTIASSRPWVYVLENVTGILWKGGLKKLTEKLAIVKGYTVVTFRDLCPTQFGVPQRRTRVYVVGIRTDLLQVPPESLAAEMTRLIKSVKVETRDFGRYLAEARVPMKIASATSKEEDPSCTCGVDKACEVRTYASMDIPKS